MYTLLQDYLSERLQAHFDELQLPQTNILLEHKALVDALRAKGAIQNEEAPEESNIFRWPWSLKGDDSDPLFLKHCCLRFFYTYSGGKWEKRELYFTMGLFSTFACKNENSEELADEIMHIDNELIPLWMKDFEALSPKDVMDRAMKCFCHQVQKFHEKGLVLDTFAASVYGVSVTQVRQTISRKRNGFTEECAFHLTYEEQKEWYKKYINPPKIRKSDYQPYAITFEGFCLLSMRLPSQIAIKTNIGIIETISAKYSHGRDAKEVFSNHKNIKLMSGGHFDYHQYQIKEIADTIEVEIARALLPKPQIVHEDYWVIHEHDCPSSYHWYCNHLEFKAYKEAESFLLMHEAVVPSEQNYGISFIEKDDKVFRSTKSVMSGTEETSPIPWLYTIHHCVYDHYPYDANVLELNKETIETMKQAYLQIRKAYVYAQRVDWMLSGDDGEDDLQTRLKEELDEVLQEFDNKDWTCPYEGWDEDE